MNVSSMTTVQDSTVKFTFSIGLLSSVERCLRLLRSSRGAAAAALSD